MAIGIPLYIPAAMLVDATLTVKVQLTPCGGGLSQALATHRFSTVRMAGQIVMLDVTPVVERGTHEELPAKRGR